MSSPAPIWRMTKERLHGYSTRSCCGAVEIRKQREYLPCPECGTRRTFTKESYPVTTFGEKWIEIRTGIRVEISIRVSEKDFT